MFPADVMVVPYTDLICEILLFSEVLVTNIHLLAKKTLIYSMASG
jgi:hypothetical protein